MASSMVSSIAGFTVLPVIYPTSTHYIYVRSHVGPKKSKNKDFPDDRTLFVVNVPPDATERELVLLFKHCGTVERVVFDSDVGTQQVQEHEDEDSDSDSEGAADDAMDVGDESEPPHKKRRVFQDTKAPKIIPLPRKPLRVFRRTGRSAHIIFLDSSSVDHAITPSQKPRPWPSSEEPFGLAHYTALYDSLRPPLDAVRSHVDSFMEAFEHELAKKRRAQGKYKKGEAIVDEDGFTLVVRGGTYGQTIGGGVGVASKAFQKTGQSRSGGGRNKKKKVKDRAGFYAFEKAEKQRKEIMDLKKNWEADKEKVAKLRESRRFKPY